MKTREIIQKEAIQALIDNNGGTVHVLTGGGKSKILIDYLSKVVKPSNNVVITVPLSTLTTNWIDEFKKWRDCKIIDFNVSSMQLKVMIDENQYYNVYICTIQGIYNKPSAKIIDFLVIDEIHTTVTSEYSRVFETNKGNIVIGLTATPDILRKSEKKDVYDRYCPIIYEYLDGESDGVVNKTRFKIIEHELNDFFTINTGPKHKQWSVGEAKQHAYLTEQIKRGQIEMAKAGSSNFFSDASEWFWQKKGTKEQSDAGRKYLGSITNRRKFLLSLQSSAEICKRLAKNILLEDDANKVLVFSEQVDQLKKICKFNVYGEQGKITNGEIIAGFNDGSIRAVGSCYSLTLGVNLIGANNAIMESYSGSDTKAIQRIGRLHRLSTDSIATIYLIKILNTQSEQWFERMMSDYDLSEAETISSHLILK